MKFVIILFSCIIFPFVGGEMYRHRVIGGHPAVIENHPWQASIRTGNRHLCGGSVINEYYILTAAHCLRNIYRIYKVQLGSNKLNDPNSTTYDVVRIIVHEKYVPYTLDFDVGLLEVAGPIQFSERVHPVYLPKSNHSHLDDGQFVVLSGFGHTIEGDAKSGSIELMEAELEIFDHDNCTEVLKNFGHVTENMICAISEDGNKDACQGDSGGPLSRNGVLYGIVSWGVGCARENFPGVYSDVIRMSDWIQENMVRVASN